MIASIVLELSNNKKEIEKIGKNNYLKNKMLKMSNYSLTLKLVDRLANILDFPKKEYVKDTLKLIQYLKNNRNLNNTQLKIIKDLKLFCIKKLKNK